MVSLRPLQKSDAQYICNHLNDKRVTRYLSDRIPSPYLLEHANWFIDHGSKQQAINYAIEVNGKFCGIVGVYLMEELHQGELGYWIAHDNWNKGVMTTAVNLFVNKIFNETQLIYLFNPITKENIGSIKALVKNGFILNKVLKDSITKDGLTSDEHVYSIEKTNWCNNGD